MFEIMIALTALLLSVLALGLQAWTWKRNGPVVAVSATNAITAPIPYGEPEHYVQVSAINQGRAPVTVSGWGFALPGGDDYVQFRPVGFATSLPHRLEPHTRADFFIEAHHLRQIAAERRIEFANITPWVRLQTGRTVKARKGVPLKR